MILPFSFRLLFYKRIWHIYFRISVGLIIICSVIISLNAGIVSYLFIYFNLDISNNNITEGRDVYNTFRSFQPSTNDSYRYTMWVLCGERLLATLKFKSYQKHKNKLFAPLSFVFVVVATLLTKFLMEIFKIQKYANHIYTIMDIPLLIIIFILLTMNCRKKKNALISGADLATKFQLNENYLLIMFSLPIITFNVLQLFIINIIAIKINVFKLNHNQLFMIVYTFRIIAYILFQVYLFLNKYIFTLIKMKFEKKVIPIEIKQSKQTTMDNKHYNDQQNKVAIEKDIYFKMLEKDLNKKIIT
uniref:G-protein coupled receptors family 1 profile domain-containing protein n=1 Tax=Strongyloides stercoralis TaxID=6248 RepID=A0A0K0E2B0_STRER